MKTLLRPYLLDFLKKQGYRYFLSRKVPYNPEKSCSGIELTPVTQRPETSIPFIGFDTCFQISKQPENITLISPEKEITVFIKNEDICALKKYLLKFF